MKAIKCEQETDNYNETKYSYNQDYYSDDYEYGYDYDSQLDDSYSDNTQVNIIA